MTVSTKIALWPELNSWMTPSQRRNYHSFTDMCTEINQRSKIRWNNQKWPYLVFHLTLPVKLNTLSRLILSHMRINRNRLPCLTMELWDPVRRPISWYVSPWYVFHGTVKLQEAHMVILEGAAILTTIGDVCKWVFKIWRKSPRAFVIPLQSSRKFVYA